ncbi:hypothetical protein, partial [Paraburkholderia sp. RL17-347-BIC-D]|uniref:hypothetical protein n=1 Tax=Paraburkholderia sp. RL17-347-BIC-D TaxID=3031632 RepID=UPI0038BDB730
CPYLKSKHDFFNRFVRTRSDADLDRSLIVTCAKGKNRPTAADPTGAVVMTAFKLEGPFASSIWPSSRDEADDGSSVQACGCHYY